MVAIVSEFWAVRMEGRDWRNDDDTSKDAYCLHLLLALKCTGDKEMRPFDLEDVQTTTCARLSPRRQHRQVLTLSMSRCCTRCDYIPGCVRHVIVPCRCCLSSTLPRQPLDVWACCVYETAYKCMLGLISPVHCNFIDITIARSLLFPPNCMHGQAHSDSLPDSHTRLAASIKQEISLEYQKLYLACEDGKLNVVKQELESHPDWKNKVLVAPVCVANICIAVHFIELLYGHICTFRRWFLTQWQYQLDISTSFLYPITHSFACRA